jgi:hypothetical protein
MPVEQPLIDRTVALNAGVDDAPFRSGPRRVQLLLEQVAVGFLRLDLHGHHERIAEHHNPALVRRLRSDVGVLAHTLRVDVQVRAELDCGVCGVGVRPQAIADLRVLHEQFLEGRRSLGLVEAKRRFEHCELGDENHDRQKDAAAQRSWQARQEISAHEVRRILSKP